MISDAGGEALMSKTSHPEQKISKFSLIHHPGRAFTRQNSFNQKRPYGPARQKGNQKKSICHSFNPDSLDRSRFCVRKRSVTLECLEETNSRIEAGGERGMPEVPARTCI